MEDAGGLTKYKLHIIKFSRRNPIFVNPDKIKHQQNTIKKIDAWSALFECKNAIKCTVSNY